MNTEQTSRILEYRVIEGDKARYFSEDINNMIEQGFQPYGQLVVMSFDNTERYYQAMVRFE